MSNAELIQAIRNEIERLRGIGGIVPFDNREQKTGYESALIDIEFFLDSLESEKPMQDGLEEEIERYIPTSLAVKFPTTDIETIKSDIRYIARRFAKWGAEHLKKGNDIPVG